MAHLPFLIDGKFFAIALQQLNAVLPAVDVPARGHMGSSLAGELAYRGRKIPVIDVSLEHGGAAVARCLGTRILLVSIEGREIGLLAEGATHPVNLDPGLSLHGPVCCIVTPDQLLGDETKRMVAEFDVGATSK